MRGQDRPQAAARPRDFWEPFSSRRLASVRGSGFGRCWTGSCTSERSGVVSLRNPHNTEGMAAESLGQRIRTQRLALELTQREVADAVGITVPYMSKIEADRETPTDDKLKKLAQTLRMNADELILAAGRIPTDVMDRLSADPAKGLEFLRTVRN